MLVCVRKQYWVESGGPLVFVVALWAYPAPLSSSRFLLRLATSLAVAPSCLFLWTSLPDVVTVCAAFSPSKSVHIARCHSPWTPSRLHVCLPGASRTLLMPPARRAADAPPGAYATQLPAFDERQHWHLSRPGSQSGDPSAPQLVRSRVQALPADAEMRAAPTQQIGRAHV